MQTSFVKVKGLKPRVDVFTKKLHNNMTRLWKDATRAFIAETISLIHVDTGMSRSSLVPLGRMVKMVTAVKAFNPKRGPWPSRSPAKGEALGAKSFRLNFGTPARPVFLFEFNINVFQWSLHDDEWRALESGQEAFLNYLKENAINYVPRLDEWILPET